MSNDNNDPSEGLFFDDVDVEILTAALSAQRDDYLRSAAAEDLDDEERADYEAAAEGASRLLSRVKVHKHGRTGMTNERGQYWQARIFAAMKAGDTQVVLEEFGGMWEEVCRLDPDPALSMGELIPAMIEQSSTKASVTMIKIIGAKLAAASRRHSDANALADELGNWLMSCEDSLARGEGLDLEGDPDFSNLDPASLN